MRKIKLNRRERAVENALLKGEYANVAKSELESIARSIEMRRKDAVLNIRVNSKDLEGIKQKASRLGVKYQTFISELLHRVAHS